MTKTIQKENKGLHQCEECGFQYVDKEWAEKCETWCKEHQSCNIEITSHVVQETVTTSGDNKFLTELFYGLIGFSASLAFFLGLYWSLRLNSSIDQLIRDFISVSLYFWPYVILTLGAIMLFGVNVSFFVYRWRKFGPPKLKTGASGGAGTIVGIAASACPVCGSTILSLIGIAGGLAAFPFQGLELKALSFGLMALSVWLMRRDLKKLECGDTTCPVPKDHRFKESDRPWLFVLVVLVIALSLISWNWLKVEPIIFN